MIEEIKRIIIDQKHFSKSNYPFQIKSNFSTLGSIRETSPQGTIIGFLFDDSIRDPLGFHAITLNETYNLSPNPVDISSFDSIFLGTKVAQRMIFKGIRSGIIHKWTMTVDPGNKYVKKFAGGITWSMMETKDVISSISLNIKIENNKVASFNGQSISFRLSIKEI